MCVWEGDEVKNEHKVPATECFRVFEAVRSTDHECLISLSDINLVSIFQCVTLHVWRSNL